MVLIASFDEEFRCDFWLSNSMIKWPSMYVGRDCMKFGNIKYFPANDFSSRTPHDHVGSLLLLGTPSYLHCKKVQNLTVIRHTYTKENNKCYIKENAFENNWIMKCLLVSKVVMYKCTSPWKNSSINQILKSTGFILYMQSAVQTSSTDQ